MRPSHYRVQYQRNAVQSSPILHWWMLAYVQLRLDLV
jgi:hypothetical protein